MWPDMLRFDFRCWRQVGRWGLALGGLLGLALSLMGCGSDRYDHDPPHGQGAIIVDNFTGDRIRVYVDGERLSDTRRGRSRAYDLQPGVYRVALDSGERYRSWADDVDVLEGRLTILEVRGDVGDYRHFDVYAYFD